jgi:hypothetical protein
VQSVPGNFLCGGMQVESELTRNAEKRGEVSRYSDMTSGHIGNQIYGGEGCEKNLGGGKPCAGAYPLGGGGCRGLGKRKKVKGAGFHDFSP